MPLFATVRRHVTAFFHPSLWRQERIEAMATLDVQWARANIDPAWLHRARYASPDIAAPLRHKSAQWLRENSMSDIHGAILPPA